MKRCLSALFVAFPSPDYGRLQSKAGVYVGSRNTTAGAIRGPQHGVSQSPGCFRLAWGEGDRPLQLPPQCSTHPLRGPHPGTMVRWYDVLRMSGLSGGSRIVRCELVAPIGGEQGRQRNGSVCRGSQVLKGCFRLRFKAGG